MKEFVATLDNETTVEIEATSLGEAVEEACWVFGEDHYILAVEEKGVSHDGLWVLTDTRGFVSDEYDSKEEAIAHGDVGGEVLIAVPKA